MYSKSINVIGIMSGTSLDGLDLCLVSFDSNNYSNFKILNSQTYNYSSDWVNKLSNAINLREKDLNILDDEFGKLISNYINKFLTLPRTALCNALIWSKNTSPPLSKRRVPVLANSLKTVSSRR